MSPTETATILRQFNEWRRGGDIDPPGTLAVGEAIDAAVEMIDRLEAAEKERDALRARIEAMEQQVPICRAEDLRHAEILLPSLGLMPEEKLYALSGAKAQPATSVPDGWTLVPIVSTAEMDNAGADHCDGYLSTAQAVWDAMLAVGAQPAPSVPDGWKLVPIEPTEDMLRAMTDPFIAINGDNRKAFEIAYTAMLSAAPEAKP